MASGSGQADLVEVIVENAPDRHKLLRSKGAGGMTALHYAAACHGEDEGYGSALERLLRLGAPVEERDVHGRTALHAAAAASGRAAGRVRALLAGGADPAARNDRGRKPAEVSLDRSTLFLFFKQTKPNIPPFLKMIKDNRTENNFNTFFVIFSPGD